MSNEILVSQGPAPVMCPHPSCRDSHAAGVCNPQPPPHRERVRAAMPGEIDIREAADEALAIILCKGWPHGG